eukprot:4345434-Prymnesium_polylepis.2
MHRRRTLEPPYRHHDRLEGARVDRPLLPRCAVRIAPKANGQGVRSGCASHRQSHRARRSALHALASRSSRPRTG